VALQVVGRQRVRRHDSCFVARKCSTSGKCKVLDDWKEIPSQYDSAADGKRRAFTSVTKCWKAPTITSPSWA